MTTILKTLGNEALRRIIATDPTHADAAQIVLDDRAIPNRDHALAYLKRVAATPSAKCTYGALLAHCYDFNDWHDAPSKHRDLAAKVCHSIGMACHALGLPWLNACVVQSTTGEVGDNHLAPKRDCGFDIDMIDPVLDAQRERKIAHDWAIRNR